MVRRLITAIWAWLRGERRQTRRVDPWDEVNARFIADVERGKALQAEWRADVEATRERFASAFDKAKYDATVLQLKADLAAFDAQLALDVPFVSEDSGTMRLQTADVRFPKPSYLIEYKAPLDVERRNQQLERDVVDWMRKSCACETCAAKRRGLS